MRLGELSNEDLVAEYGRTGSDDRTAIADELFGRCYAQVAGWCFGFTGSREAAADLAQDVFLKAHLHLESFRGTSRFSTWLYSIARNEAINRRRHTDPAIQDERAIAAAPVADPDPEELAELRTRARHLMVFLSATLDDTERMVFILHYGNDMPVAAITELMHLGNASGAKAYIVSARRKLARAVRRLRRGAASL